MSQATPSWYGESGWFEKALWEKEMIFYPANVSFRGEIRHMDGRGLSDRELMLIHHIVEPVASATGRIGILDPDQFKPGISAIAPKTTIVFGGMPNAWALVAGEGELVIPLGMLFTIASLPSVYQLIDRMVGSGPTPQT